MTRRIVLTGSESTGKTTLARELAALYHAPWTPEFARIYLDAMDRPLDARDVEPIALGQMAIEDTTRRALPKLLIHDTDLVSTVVYARHYYGNCPPWIEVAAVERRADLYLLECPDVPWVADSQRDRPDRREEMHAAFVALLASVGARSVELRGGWDARRQVAHAAIAQLCEQQVPQ